MSELDSRSNKLARETEISGGELAIRFQFGDMDRKMGDIQMTPLRILMFLKCVLCICYNILMGKIL